MRRCWDRGKHLVIRLWHFGATRVRDVEVSASN